MSYRGWWLAAVLLVSGGPLGAEGEFPIGAWFPGMIAGEKKTPTPEDLRVWGVRLDSVKAQGFNTIHARQGRGELRTSKYNRAWMALAHARGLKVQLHSWQQPPDWRSFSRNYWTRVFEAEDGDSFTSPIGASKVTEADGRVARYAATKEHNAGLLLESEGSVYLRRNPDTDSGFGSRFGHHVFRLKTDDATGTAHLATLRVLLRDGTVMDSLEVFEDRFMAANTYQDFGLEYDIGPKTDDRGSIPVRYQVYWTEVDSLWVDHIRAHDFEIVKDDTLRPPRADQLFRGERDDAIRDTLAAYSADPPWRFALYDEPRWEVNESVAYVDRLIRRQTGGTSGISPYNQMARDAMELYVDTVSPPELLVDYYPFFENTPAPGRAGYANALRGRLDWLVGGYGNARAVSLGHRLREDGSEAKSVKPRIPLWAVVQVHNHSNLRNPTPEEIRAQVNLALAHGATGIYYYLYHSYIVHNDDGTERRVNGLMNRNWRRTPRLDAVEALNAKMDSLDSTLLALTSDHVFPGNRPADFVVRLSETADFFLGTFTHRDDGSRYLMVVNERTRPARVTPDDTRSVTVTLNATSLAGADFREFGFRLHDVYEDSLAEDRSSNANRPAFSMTLPPGGGALYRVEVVPRPVVPKDLAAMPGFKQVRLSWTDPDDDRITGWEYRYKREKGKPGGWTAMDTARVKTIPGSKPLTLAYSVPSLIDGADYVFHVRAVIGSIEGAWARVEAMPSGLRATPLNAAVRLLWQDPGVPELEGWQYRQRALTPPGGWSPSWTDMGGAGTREYVVRNLTNGTEYRFRVQGVDAAGDSVYEWRHRVGATPQETHPDPPNRAPVITAGPDSVAFAENGPDLVATYAATDADGDSLRWTRFGTDAADFDVRGDTLFFVASPNYEAPTDRAPGQGLNAEDAGDNTYEVSLVVHDRAAGEEGLTDTVKVTVEVVNVNEAPRVIGPDSVGVLEGTTRVGLYEAADPDVGQTDSLAWARSGPDASLFELRALDPPVASKRELHYRSAPVFSERPDTVRVVVKDPGGLKDGVEVKVTLVRVAVSGPADTSLAENGPTRVGTYTGVGVDTLFLEGAQADSLELRPLSPPVATKRDLYFRNVPNYEDTSRYEVQVIGRNKAAMVDDTLEVVVTVLDRNDPGFVTLANMRPRVAESIPARLFDEDGGVENTLWSLLESTPSDGASAQGQGQPQAQASIDLYVPLTALGKQLQARVNYKDNYAEENTAFSDTTEAVRANVPGAPDSLQATPGHRQVRLTWNAAWDRGDSVDSYQVRLDTGSWSTVPGGGEARNTTMAGLTNGTSYTFYVRARNSVGTGASASVAATPVNRKPVCTGPATKSLAENGSKAIGTYTCTDPGDAITWDLKGAQADSLQLQPLSPPQATKRNLTFRKVPNYEVRSSYAALVIGRDSGGLSDTVEVTVTVSDSLDPGVVTLSNTRPRVAEWITAELFDEDGGVESTLWTWPETTPSDGASAQSQGQADASITHYVPLRALGKQLQARVNYDDNYAEENTAISDKTEAVRANVPGAPQSLQATSGHRHVHLRWNAASARGDSVDRYQVRLNTGSWSTVPGGGGARDTTMTNLTNGTSYTLYVRARNSVGTGASASVAAEPVNRKPVCTGPATKSLAENGSKAIGTYTCTDPGDAITWLRKGPQASSFELAALSPAQATKRNLNLGSVPNFEARSSYRVSVVGRDSGGLSDTVDVTVTITDVNERPNVSGSTTVSVPERTKQVATYTGTDPDAGDAAGLTWSLDSTHASLFELKTITSQPTKRRVQFKSVPHFTRSIPSANTKVVAVVVKDSSDLSDRETVTVTITDVDDPGLVTVTPSSPRVGQTVTAILTDSDGGIADTSWSWKPDHSSDGVSASGLPAVQRRSEREVVEADVGKRIQATASYDDNHGSGKSATGKTTNTVSAIPPGRPSLRVSAGDARATLSWTPPTTTGGAAIDRYQVFRSPGGSWSTVPGGGGARDTTMTGLTNGTSYTFYVRAHNSAGWGSSDSEKARPRGRPGAPKNLEAQRGSRRATLNWDAADSNGSWIDRYEYKVLPGGTSWSTVSGGNGARSKTILSLTNGTTYTFYVRAENDVGKGAPASDTVTPAGPPGYPDSLATDRQGGNGFMELSWAAAPDNGSPVLHYYYRYKKTTDTNWRGWYRRFGGGAARSKTWNNFDDGATYTFQLRARNDVGYGPVAQISAQPLGAGGTSQPAQSQSESTEEADDELMPAGEVPEPGEGELLIVDAEPGETAKPVAAGGPGPGPAGVACRHHGPQSVQRLHHPGRPPARAGPGDADRLQHHRPGRGRGRRPGPGRRGPPAGVGRPPPARASGGLGSVSLPPGRRAAGPHRQARLDPVAPRRPTPPTPAPSGRTGSTRPSPPPAP